MSLIVSLAPFQLLIYIFPTLLFFISLISRLILTFSNKNDTVQEMFSYVDNIVAKIVNDINNKPNIDINDLIKKAILPTTDEQGTLSTENVFQNNSLIQQQKKKRNSDFLYSLFIDSLALSIANGVIIMFEAQNLLYGFILLFIGVIFCSFGFTALYANRLGFATLIVLIIMVVVFISELVYLLTSNIIWFFIIPKWFVIITVIVVVIIIVNEERKKKKSKQINT